MKTTFKFGRLYSIAKNKTKAAINYLNQELTVSKNINDWRIVKRLDISDRRGEKDSFQPQVRNCGGWKDALKSTETENEAIMSVKAFCGVNEFAETENVVWIGKV
jgi:hypothetical protein